MNLASYQLLHSTMWPGINDPDLEGWQWLPALPYLTGRKLTKVGGHPSVLTHGAFHRLTPQNSDTSAQGALLRGKEELS